LSAALPIPGRADPIAPEGEHCVINVRSDDVLNLREGPSARTPSQTGLRYGQCGIMVTGECRGDWCPVEDGHYAGWAHRHYLGMVSPAMYCVTGVTGGDVLNLRAWPAATSRVLVRLGPHDCGISILPYARNGWQKVRSGGWEGWVRRNFLTGQ
jgi:SH3-like domain-containing protein